MHCFRWQTSPEVCREKREPVSGDVRNVIMFQQQFKQIGVKMNGHRCAFTAFEPPNALALPTSNTE